MEYDFFALLCHLTLLYQTAEVATGASIVTPTRLAQYSGKSVRIRCLGKNPHWLKDDKLLTEINEYEIDLTEPNALFILNTGLHHTGNYTCIAEDNKENIRTGMSMLYIGVMKENVIEPNLMKALIGTIKSFYCDLDKRQWFYEKKELPRNTFVAPHQKTLSIMIAKLENSGYYYCYGFDAEKIPVLSEARLLPKDQTRIVPSRTIATLGGRVRFKCYSSIPFLTEWTFNEGPLPRGIQTETEFDTLVIPRVSRAHEGRYECFGIAPAGDRKVKFVAIAELKVSDKSSFERGCSYLWSAIFGDSTSYTCKSDKSLNWIWNFNGEDLPSNAHQQTASPSKTSSLSITNVQPRNAGTYECRGYNKSKLVDTQECRLEVVRQRPMTEVDKNLKIRNSLALMLGHPADCPIVEFPHGNVQYQGLSPGDTAVFKCSDGFKMVGNLVRQCQKNGKWSGSSKCITITEGAQDSKNGHSIVFFVIIFILLS